MLSTTLNPAQILGSYRKSDAVVIVCQNNQRRLVEIAAINDEVARLSGYSNEDLLGQPLTRILPERLAEILGEFVEFEDGQNDLLAVLNKIRDFALVAKDGRELHFRLRIIRGEAIDRNPWFHLVLVDEEKMRRRNAFREVLRENFKGHEVLDPRTALPDRGSLIKDLELVTYHVRNKEILGTFAVVDINGYEELRERKGERVCDQLHRHIGQVCKQRLRLEDTVGSLSECMLGIVMVDAVPEAAHMVLNRLRWAIGTAPFIRAGHKDMPAQVNIGFLGIDGGLDQNRLVEKCETFMAQLRERAANSVHPVMTLERRVLERREDEKPVRKDRRSKERREKKDESQ